MGRNENSQHETKPFRRIAIYSRKSKFTEKGDSIHNQIEVCRAHIAYIYPEFPQDQVVIYEDEGYSGGNVKRPEFQRMMEDIRDKQIEVVVCYRLDRISRNTADFVNVLAEFKRHKVSFISKSDNFDTKTPTGRAMMQMVAVFAEMERNVIAERIRDNMYELAKSGRWLGGNTPTGYKSEQFVQAQLADGRVRKAFKLEQVAVEIEKIRLIFAKYLEYGVLAKVETYLLQHHQKSKKGRNYSSFAIRNILQNPVYLIADQDAWTYFAEQGVTVFSPQESFDGKHGIMAYNKTKQDEGSSNEYMDVTEWVIAVGLHEGVICGADWVKVQRMLTINKTKSYRKPKTTTALLSGLLFCADCGAYIRPKLSQRYNADNEVIYDYLCETKEKSRGALCQMKRANGNELDKAVCDTVFQVADNMEYYVHQLQATMKRHGTQADIMEQEKKTINRIVETRQLEINNLLNKLAQGDDNPIFLEYVKNKVEELDQECKQLQQRKVEIQEMQEQTDVSGMDIEIFEEALTSFSNNFMQMSIKDKCDALKLIINRIEWDGENVHVYFISSPEGELELDNELEYDEDDEEAFETESKAVAMGLRMKSS